MASGTQTLEVRLHQDPFCVATGPQDTGIVYPCAVHAFAPVLLDSPVAFHLYLPDLFPDEVLKIHAEHLGHFLALQSIPKVNKELERTLFRGLCRLFTRERVLTVYSDALGDTSLRDDLPCGLPTSDCEDDESEPPYVFATFGKGKAKRALALLRGLLSLFNTAELCEEIPHSPDHEPEHMLFLYLIQLMVVFVSSQMGEKDLATVVGVASSVFLEANLSQPLCAATILKPMFIPYYEQQSCRPKKKRDVKNVQTVHSAPKLSGYRLFTGYELNDKGQDVSASGDLEWTEHSILNCIQGPKLEERNTRKMWFVAPQMGDRLNMTNPEALQLMGRQTCEKAVKITEYLVSDNVMAYMQSSVIGTLCNMLPCHANSEFDEPVMNAIDFSMSRFSEVVRHQGINLLSELQPLMDSCLYVTGVGFAGQDSGTSLHFGRIFTGSEEKRIHGQGSYGTFTSVTLGVMRETMMSNMLFIAFNRNPKSPVVRGVHATLATQYKQMPRWTSTITDMHMYARYHHRFNSGEFTEVARVKPMSDSTNNNPGTETTLTTNSKYQLTVVHGALPMCGLSLAITMRQTMIMVTGFLCAEIARCIYGQSSDMAVCRSITALSMYCKFKPPKKDQGTLNTLSSSFGELLKVTGPVFSGSTRRGDDLSNMEWLDAADYRLPDYIRTSLSMLGDTRQLVEQIMREKNVSYNRVVFITNKRRMDMVQLYENEKGMVQAPLMLMCNMRIFTNSSNSYAACNFSKKGCYYPVKVFSNSCVKTRLYHRDDLSELQCLMRPTRSTIDDVLESVQREVSCALPRIDINRVRMLAADMTPEDFDSLICAIKNRSIQVIGLASSSSAPATDSQTQKGTERRHEDRDETQDERNHEYSDNTPMSDRSLKRKERDDDEHDEKGVVERISSGKVGKTVHVSQSSWNCEPTSSKKSSPAYQRAMDDGGSEQTEAKRAGQLSIVDESDVDFGFDDSD